MSQECKYYTVYAPIEAELRKVIENHAESNELWMAYNTKYWNLSFNSMEELDKKTEEITPKSEPLRTYIIGVRKGIGTHELIHKLIELHRDYPDHPICKKAKSHEKYLSENNWFYTEEK